jgi:LAO/AO transport system kinase
LLCEAAGFDVVLIETVGVGQSEVAVRSIVDFFALLTITGGGDELQSAKRGIMELVDAILVTKADGDNAQPAATLCSQLETALAHLRGPLDGWRPRVHTCSALTGTGLSEIWRLIEEFYRAMRASGALHTRRQRQVLAGMETQFEAALKAHFLADPAVVQERERLQNEVRSGRLDPLVAAEQLARFRGSNV